jgi:membrane-associated phospholipid phosphatase
VTSRVGSALLAAGACAAGVVVLFVLSFHSSAVSRAEVEAYVGFTAMLEPDSKPVNDFVGLVDPLHFGLLAVAVPVVAAVRRRWAVAVAAAAAIAGSALTTQALQLLVDMPRAVSSHVELSWPSGHMTAASVVAMTLVLVLPAALRPYGAVLGALWTLAIAYGIVMLGMHLPSDVVAGMLVAGAWVALAVAVLRLWHAEPQAPPETTARRFAPAAGGTLIAVAAVLLGWDHFVAALDAPGEDATVVATAVVLAAVAITVVAATAVARRRVA